MIWFYVIWFKKMSLYVIKMLSLKTQTVATASVKRSVKCQASHHRLQTEINKFIDKRRALDQRRAEEVKAAADKLREIARQEIKSSLELASIVVPVEQLKKACQDKEKKPCCEKKAAAVGVDEAEDAAEDA